MKTPIGNVWRPALAADEPRTTLTGWAVFEARLDSSPDVLTRHLAGYANEACEGRASSAIVELDVDARTARTESGRIYVLAGSPGMRQGGDAAYTWVRFVQLNEATEVREITRELFPPS